MPKKPTYNLERVWFTVATEALIRDEMRHSGTQAYLAAIALKAEHFPAIYDLGLNPEFTQYVDRMGEYVELAAELSQGVDQQR